MWRGNRAGPARAQARRGPLPSFDTWLKTARGLGGEVRLEGSTQNPKGLSFRSFPNPNQRVKPASDICRSGEQHWHSQNMLKRIVLNAILSSPESPLERRRLWGIGGAALRYRSSSYVLVGRKATHLADQDLDPQPPAEVQFGLPEVSVEKKTPTQTANRNQLGFLPESSVSNLGPLQKLSLRPNWICRAEVLVDRI